MTWKEIWHILIYSIVIFSKCKKRATYPQGNFRWCVCIFLTVTWSGMVCCGYVGPAVSLPVWYALFHSMCLSLWTERVNTQVCHPSSDRIHHSCGYNHRKRVLTWQRKTKRSDTGCETGKYRNESSPFLISDLIQVYQRTLPLETVEDGYEPLK